LAERDDGLSDQRTTEIYLAALGVAFVAILTPRVALTMDAAWRANGIGRTIAFGVIDLLPVVDKVMVLPLGLVVAWLALFAFDRSKRLQTPVALLGAVAFGTVVVVFQNRWDSVALGADWPVLAVGAGVGLATGLAPQLSGGRRTREFPVAAWGLFGTAAVLGVVSLLDLYLLGDQVTVSGWLLPPPGTALGAVVDTVAVAVFVVAVGLLVLYTDRREAVLFDASGGRNTASVFAGLLDETDPAHSGRVTAGNGNAVLNAQRAVRNGEVPEPVTERTEVTFLPPRRFSRWVTVGGEQHDPAAIDAETVEREVEPPGPGDAFAQLVPKRLRRWGRPDAVRMATKLRRADLVLYLVSMDELVVPAEEQLRSADGNSGLPVDSDTVETYRTLSRSLAPHTEQVVILLGAERAAELYEVSEGIAEARLDDDGFRGWLQEDLLGIGGVTVVPLDSGAAADEQLLANVAMLREVLER
jgi:hypothetical protein